jgi:hypothetical protein
MKLGNVLKKISTLVIIVWLILIVLFLIVPANSNAVTILPIATIGLDQPVQVADVSPNGTGLVTFTGTVSCELNQFTTAVVSLNSEDTWNSSVVVPSSLQFSSSDPGDKEFEVTVKAPLGTSRNTVGQVVVSGRVVMYPGSVYGTCQPSDGVVGRIDIAPYYEFVVYTNEDLIQTRPDKTVKGDFTIQNNGNIRDTYEVSIPNENQLYNKGIQVTSENEIIDIEEREEKRVDFTIITSKDAAKYETYSINFNIASILGGVDHGCPEQSIIIEFRIGDISISTSDPFPLPDTNGVEEGEGDIEFNEGGKTEETKALFTPGFETVSMIICTFILILIFRKSNKYRRG